MVFSSFAGLLLLAEAENFHANIVWEATGLCPPPELFVQELKKRSVPELAQTSVHIRLFPTSEGYEASLNVKFGSGKSAERKLNGPTCAETVVGLALVLAVLADENEVRRTAREDTGEREVALQRPPMGKGNLRNSNIVAWGGVTGGLGATLAPEITLHYRRAFTVFAADLRASVGLSAARGSAYVENGGTIEFSRLRGETFLCPVELGIRFFSLHPCLGASGGLLHAEPYGVPSGVSRTRPYLAASSLLVGFLPLPSSLQLEAGAGLDVGLVRDEFVVDKTVQVYESPRFTGRLFGGLGARF